ncbi:hypothetical protein [Paenibacillus wulumuqiensis]|uniref:hypothetical protein n=1 Tax=Paenibacillus wulumuqiensis TaxID=1567107 RepID=UPI0006195BC2|nr:hypothetical protein [Paenibacillus wulumuqiensis]
MTNTINHLQYSEKYGCWEGELHVQLPPSLSSTAPYPVAILIDTSNPLTDRDTNTIHYIRDHFSNIYYSFLEALLSWQSEGHVFESYEEQTGSFVPLHFVNPQDIHIYLGTPVLQILPGYFQGEFSYYSLEFFKNCRLSIEHGLTGIFHNNILIDLAPSDTEAMLSLLSYIEPDYERWKKDFWKVTFTLKDKIFEDPAVSKQMWLGRS